jgi:hypothetical protein
LANVNSNGVGANGNSDIGFASINGNGALVAFSSEGTNLYPNDTNGTADTFVHAM